MSHVADTLLPSLKLYEYYVIDAKREMERFEGAWSAKSFSAVDAPKSSLLGLSDKDLGIAFADACLPATWKQLGGRFQTVVDSKVAVAFVASLSSGEISPKTASATFQRLIDLVNLPRYEEYDSDLATIISNTKNRIKYTRLDEHGPRMGPITATYVPPSFFLGWTPH